LGKKLGKPAKPDSFFAGSNGTCTAGSNDTCTVVKLRHIINYHPPLFSLNLGKKLGKPAKPDSFFAGSNGTCTVVKPRPPEPLITNP